MAPKSYAEMIEVAQTADPGVVIVERDASRVIVRMNDPASLNALSAPLTVRLLDVLLELRQDPSVRSVILTGTDPAFSAGGDIRAMKSTVEPLIAGGSEGVTSMWRWIRYQFGGVVRTIAQTDKVFIAAVNGACAGVGFAFAMACDIIIASERARFLTAFGRIGLVPEVGTSWLLTRRLGYQKAFEMFATGKTLSGEEARALGLVNEVVPHEELLPHAIEWAQRMEKVPEHALAMAKPLLRHAADMTWDQAIAMEEFAEPMCFTTQAHRDAILAFLEKRPAEA